MDRASVHLNVHDVHLSVPNFVHSERNSRGWSGTLLVAATSRLRREYRPLLNGISFFLEEGDRLALLGRNGAGKTTLLRVLTGALKPTQGHLDIQGSRQALLNLGLGFNPEATLKENIYLRGTAMGLRPAQVRELVEPSLVFAGLEDVGSHRLATLSSGQRMRLGFAISTAVQHDIMLLDEWFGAGDAEFVQRARDRMSDRVTGSKIVVLASHNSSMLRKVCNLGLVMDGGKMTFFGPVEEAIAAYKSIYQATEEYKASRREIEKQAERIVRTTKLDLERREKELSQELRMLREERVALQEERAALHDERAALTDVLRGTKVSGRVQKD